MDSIEKILNEYGVMIIDGAFATELERRGFAIDDDLWSANALLKRPDLVKAVHLDYLKVGADAVISASYQATITGFMRRGLTREKSVELIQTAVRIAREARDEFWRDNAAANRPRPLVAASVGPYGAFLADGSEYRGDYDLDERGLCDFHRERLGILADARPDIFACETVPCLDEAKALTNLLADYPDFSAWVTFSAKDGMHISNGEKIADCAKWLDDKPQIAAVGINCTAPQYVASLISEIRQNTDKPIIVYPNSGETYDATTKTWHGASVSYADYAKAWREAGASIIGGCCRTSPKDIASVVRILRG